MLVRFGFVAMSAILEKASPSGTVSLKTYQSLVSKSQELALEKVRKTSQDNLTNTLRLLHHCNANHVKIYRFSSKIIPLATHPQLTHWDYLDELRQQFEAIGAFIKEHELRVSFHPDHFTVINSSNREVFSAAVRDLSHHSKMLHAMSLDNTARLIIHVGGGYGDKKKSLETFLENWAKMPSHIVARIVLENDDRTFTANDTLYLCEKLQIPLVLDVHHFRCNHEEGNRLEDVYPRFIATWKGTRLNPKLHISSPQSMANFRSHNDYIDPHCLYSVLMQLREYGTDIDVMVEAKQKDKAMFELVQALGAMPGIRQVDSAKIYI